MIIKRSRKELRKVRHLRIRKKIYGTPERPRLAVFKSLRYIYAQIIDDTKGHTLVSASSLEKELRSQLKSTKNMEAAKLVGEVIAKRALEKGIKKVVFDRGGFLYHGKVKALADSARAAGLEF
jgi:large subunit ribosomal protein L18|uniref:Large ribosomal subunit protein uL18 n=1 Tax=Dictyoglomus turgidum TaxID=513050 RepID=A0A7C3WM76_9BACT